MTSPVPSVPGSGRGEAARVIAAFPATGKSHLARQHAGVVVDSDSSEFSWERPGVRHPDWPGNYVEHIKKRLADPSVRLVLVSTHAEVRAALTDAGIPHLVVAPTDIQAADYERRMMRRGSPDALIEAVMAIWPEAIEDCLAAPNALALPPGAYLSDAAPIKAALSDTVAALSAARADVAAARAETQRVKDAVEGLRALSEAATPGPWIKGNPDQCCRGSCIHTAARSWPLLHDYEDAGLSEPDAALLVAAVNLVRAVLDGGQ